MKIEKRGKECDNERGERGYFLCWNQEMKQRGAVITPPPSGTVSLNSIWGDGGILYQKGKVSKALK